MACALRIDGATLAEKSVLRSSGTATTMGLAVEEAADGRLKEVDRDGVDWIWLVTCTEMSLEGISAGGAGGIVSGGTRITSAVQISSPK